MKRVLQIVLLLALLGGIVQVLTTVLKKKHDITYEIVSNNVIFNVKEVFENNKYHVLINKDDLMFSFTVNNDFNKKRGIVNNIDFMASGELMCIYPYLPKSVSNIICNDNREIKSYEELKNDTLVINFVSDLTAKGQSNNAWINTNNNKRTTDKLTIYYDNLTTNNRVYVWKYTGFYSVTKKIDSILNVSQKDVYSNSHGILVNNYYVFADYNQKYDFNTLVMYNMKNDLIKKIKFDQEISYDSYYNGVVGDKLYLFDKDALIQYEIDIKKKTTNIVGNKDINALYYDNGFTTRNIYDFEKNKLVFKNYTLPAEINNKEDIIKDGELYFYLEKNNMYMFDNKLKTTKLLFNRSGVNNIQISNGNVYFIIKDTLYTYSYQNGVKPLIIYKEFSFNKDNMYVAYDY